MVDDCDSWVETSLEKAQGSWSWTQKTQTREISQIERSVPREGGRRRAEAEQPTEERKAVEPRKQVSRKRDTQANGPEQKEEKKESVAAPAKEEKRGRKNEKRPEKAAPAKLVYRPKL